MGVDLIRALVESEALRVAPASDVFWYTSGKVGPYYINTPFLYGGAQAAAALLDFIAENADPRARLFAVQLSVPIETMYVGDDLHGSLIHPLAAAVRGTGESYDFISSGTPRPVFSSAVTPDPRRATVGSRPRGARPPHGAAAPPPA